VDWIHQRSDGAFSHAQDPRHATVAIADEAANVMRRHAATNAALIAGANASANASSAGTSPVLAPLFL